MRKIALMAVGDEAWIGGIQYVTNIVASINEMRLQEKPQITIFKREHQKFSFTANDFPFVELSFADIESTLPPYSFSNRVMWFLQRKMLKRVNPRFENYLLSKGYDYVYPATLSDCNGKLNVGSWIADFQYHNYPDGHSEETTKEAEQIIGFIANHMKKVIFSSAFCQQQSFELFPATKGKAYVMPFAVYIADKHMDDDHLQTVRSKYHLDSPFLMVSNLFAAVKNHKLLFQALGILRKKGIRIPLVCTGNLVNYAQMSYTNEILEEINNTGVRDQLYLLGLIPRKDQVALYRASVAMVQPSLHEGWSTCVEEAKCLGKTLILSDIPVHREQFPANPHFFNPFDAADLARVIEDVYTSGSGNTYPDREKETAAWHSYKKVMADFGNNFMAIAAKN